MRSVKINIMPPTFNYLKAPNSIKMKDEVLLMTPSSQELLILTASLLMSGEKHISKSLRSLVVIADEEPSSLVITINPGFSLLIP